MSHVVRSADLTKLQRLCGQYADRDGEVCIASAWHSLEFARGFDLLRFWGLHSHRMGPMLVSDFNRMVVSRKIVSVLSRRVRGAHNANSSGVWGEDESRDRVGHS